MSELLLEVRGLDVRFPVRIGGIVRARYAHVRAVTDFNLDLHAGETLGIVGESGCGKSTLARALLRLVRPTAGSVVWLGTDLATLDEREMNRRRDGLQIVFQDPLSSHNPRMTIGAIVEEPLRVFHSGMDGDARRAAALEIMERVGLGPAHYDCYPHELSGGQCQRVSIARALILKPRLLVCDEAVSALDVSIRAQVLNVIRDVQAATGVAVIFISHDLSVVRYVCRRVLVMYLGRVVEMGTRDDIFERPLHPYTQALVASMPVPDPRRRRPKLGELIRGELPSPLDPPSGCAFRGRCPRATPVCVKTLPALDEHMPGRRVACHHWDQGVGEPA